VRAAPSPGARAIGYLRVGGAARRSDAPVGTDGCKAGWYAVEPRGFVCDNESVTLDESAALVALARAHLAARGEPLPTPYVRVRGAPPVYYTKIPTREDMRKVEGHDVDGHIAKHAHAPDPNLALLGPMSELPALLREGGKIPRPIGSPPRLRFWVHTGHAEPNTRMAVLAHFEADGRRWALTSLLHLVALDRVQVVKPSAFRGIELGEGQDLPVGFVRGATATGHRVDEHGKPGERVAFPRRQPLRLTGNEKQEHGTRLLETGDGVWVPASALAVIEARKSLPPFVTGDDMKWIDISIRAQSLVAYRGKKAVYATLVSTGTGVLGDPETTHATPRGQFTLFAKHLSTKMSGDEIGAEYQIDDVPYVQYFHKSYAIHGAFWHDDFGHVHSHGCVNLAPADAAWLFELTEPELPRGWHGVYAAAGGTSVLIRP
jgi:hypothetical protein